MSDENAQQPEEQQEQPQVESTADSRQSTVVSPVPDARVEAESLLDVNVRFWAELGRAHMPVGRAVGLVEGAIVDLDRKAEDAVDVYVNGSHFGTGRLTLVEGEWALELVTVDAVDGVEQVSTASSDGV